MRAFVDRHGLAGIPMAVDDDGSLWARYGVTYQPAWVLINQDGDIAVNPGAFRSDQLDEALTALTSQ